MTEYKMVFEIFWILFWALTYFTIIFYGIKYHKENFIFMPLVAGSLNLACEIVSFLMKLNGNTYMVHLFSIVLDLFIFAHNVIVLKRTGKKSLIYIFLTVVVTVFLYDVFQLPLPSADPMLLSIFVIDLEMSIVYLVEIKRLSAYGRTLIGVLRFFGDLFAWLTYWGDKYVFVMGIVITVLNIYYVYYSIKMDMEKKIDCRNL